MDHLLLLCWDAILIAVFFAFLWRKSTRGRILLTLKTLSIMVVGGVILGWIMYCVP
ncbi:MAG: hypothetical protein GY906_13330 [bacterium]|nr:hypothetical protein [bacterium]